MRRFASRREDGVYSCTGACFAIGIATSTAPDRFLDTGNPVAGNADSTTAGNGSLMRVAPVAIRFWNDPAGLTDAPACQSRTTHAAPEAVDACIAFARMLSDAIVGRPLAKILGDSGSAYTGAIGDIVAGRGAPNPAMQSLRPAMSLAA